jgi:cyclophilin family peptidyl-prolyl cis-trans isomerase
VLTRTISPKLRLLAAAIFFTGAFFSPSHPASSQSNGDPIVLLQTTRGPIAIQVFVNSVPNTARNFLDLVQRGFYNGLTFHRIETWCIQGGDPNGNGTGNFTDPGTGRPRFLQLEINPQLGHNGPGVVAMARSNNPNSASCQFYITKAQMPQLNGQYAIFGHVVDGMPSVYNMCRGDQILSAQLVQGGDGGSSSAGSGLSGYSAPARKHSSGPAQDSGF